MLKMADDSTNIEELKKMLRDFAHERDWGPLHTPKDLAIAVSVEAAEILEHFRFRNDQSLREYIADRKNKKEISHEIADVMAFLLRLADEMRIDVSTALREKIEKNRERYPVQK